MAPRPNIVFIIADQMRGDFLGADGNQAVHSPHLDGLAAEGALFLRAYSSTPSCTPARAAILTGQAPWHHGLLGYARIAERYPQEWPRLLTEAGYATWFIGKNHFHPQRNLHGYEGGELDESGRVESPQFLSDYRRWFQAQAPALDPDATGIGWNDYAARSFALDERLHPTRWTGDRAVDFVEHYDKQQPFFLKVSFARPHSPYDPPQRFLDEVDRASVPEAAVGAWSELAFGDFHEPEQHQAARNNLGTELTMDARRGYAANIAFVDEQVGRIVTALEDKGMLKNTVIVFTSDHGDMLGDHHLWRKTYAYEGSSRIPMVVYWGTDIANGARGQRREELVELRDLMPTFLEAAQLPIPDTVDGASLLALLRGETEDWRIQLDLEHATCYWPGNEWTALTDAQWKYIFHAFDGREQLFNLKADPLEQEDLAANLAYAVTLADWRARMAEHLAERGGAWVQDGAPVIRKTTTLFSPYFESQ